MPQLRSKQILGETPVKPTDLTTKEYVDNFTGKTLSVQDNNSTVLSGVTIINFMGADVEVLADGTNKVNVWVPKPTYSPYFNNGAATVTPFTTFDRFISQPTSEGNPYNIGNWTGGTQHKAIRQSTVLQYTSTDFSLYNLNTTFNASILDPSNSILASNTIIISNISSVTVSGITISVTDIQPDSDRYKASITVSINLNTTLPNGGRFSISLTHNNTINTNIFTQTDIFRDIEPVSVSFGSGSTLSLSTSDTNHSKYISGVKFYTTGNTWNVSLDKINNLNNNTYPTTAQLQISENIFFVNNDLTANGNNNDFVTNTWTNYYNNTGASYQNVMTTDIINNSNWSHNTSQLLNNNITAYLYDWGVTPIVSKTSQNYNFMIDTYADTSNRNTEIFVSEKYRLQSNLTTPWDSTTNLSIIDNGNGLQILAGRLVYPKNNFITYLPANNPNYSNLSGTKYYYRRFDANGSTISNGIIVFTDHSINEDD